jgi:hypothetical protein
MGSVTSCFSFTRLGVARLQSFPWADADIVRLGLTARARTFVALSPIVLPVRDSPETLQGKVCRALVCTTPHRICDAHHCIPTWPGVGYKMPAAERIGPTLASPN